MSNGPKENQNIGSTQLTNEPGGAQNEEQDVEIEGEGSKLSEADPGIKNH